MSRFNKPQQIRKFDYSQILTLNFHINWGYSVNYGKVAVVTIEDL